MTLAEVSLSGIEFKIKGSSDAASDSIQKLIKDLGELKNALKSSEGINGLANALKKLENVNSTMLFVAKEALEGISKIDFSNIQQAADGIRDIATAARAIANIGKGKENPVEQIAGDKPQFYNAFDYLAVGAKQFWHMLERVGGAIQPVVSGVMKLAGLGAKGIFATMTYPLKTAAKNMGSMAKSVGGILGGFKRIAGYRILRTIIKEITQGFSEGIKNLYGWSTAFGGAMIAGKNFKDTMDSIATSTMYLKNSVGAAAAPFISALAPAIDFVIDKAVALLNVINQLMALFSGATSWNRAIKKTQEYGDAVGGAGSAAKEALRYLAPFDELNRLPDDKNGGGGGGSGTDYSGMFEETTEFLEGLQDFANSLKEKINQGDWQGVGVLLGEKVNSIVQYLEDNNYFALAGSKIGTAINAWFTTKYWTLQTINFTNIGENIATAFNSMIGNIDFNTIGRTITQKFTVIGDFILGAIQTIDWSLVGQSIGNFIRGAFDQLSEWLEGVNWSEFGSNLYQYLSDAVEGLNLVSIAESLMRLLGAAITAAVSLLASFISEVWEDIKGYFEQYMPNGWDSTGEEIISGIFQGIKNALLSVGTWVAENVFQPLFNGIKSAFGIASPASTMIEPGQMIGEGILEGLLQPFKNIATWIDEHIVQPIKDALKNFSIKDLIFGGDDSGSSSSGNDGWLSGIFGGSIDLEANVTSVKDSIPEDKKKIDTIANFFKFDQDFKDGAEGGLFPRLSAVARFFKFDRDFGDAASGGVYPIIGSVAKFFRFGREFDSSTSSGGLYPIIGTVAKFFKFNRDFGNSAEGGTFPIIGTVAKFFKMTREFGSSAENGTYPIIGSVAKLFKYTRDFSYGTDEEKHPVLSSIAKLYKYTKDYGGQDGDGHPILSSIAKFYDWYVTWKSLSVDANASLQNPSWKNGTPSMTVYAELQYTGGTHSGNGTYTYAKGGAYYGGAWHDIPQAAKGGQFHGTLFWAGENGAEVVGHAGGRTEVLNRSQLAATMYSAVHSAMNGIAFNVSSPSMGASATDDGTNEDMLYRAFLRALNDSDMGDRPIELDGNVLYKSVVKHNRQERVRTGMNPMLSY